MLHNLEGIVIRNVDYGETHKIITLLTKEAGKIGVMARGAKRVKSRHSAATQLFTYGEYVVFRKSGLGTLNHAEILESHHRIRADLKLAAYASYMAELMDRLLQEEDASVYLFEQLKHALNAVESGKDPALIAHSLEMKVMGAAGYEPVLSRCVACGADSPLMRLSAALGGALCESCRSRDPQSMPADESLLKLLNVLKRVDLGNLGQTRVSDANKSRVQAFLRRFIDHHVETTWKSRSFLDQMERYGW